MTTTAEIVNKIEVLRKQLEDQLKATTSPADQNAIKALDKKALDVELQLLSKADLNSDDKWFVEAYKVYLNLVWLNGEVGTGAGDMAGGADYRPTDASLATLKMLEDQLAKAKADFDRLMNVDVPAFNAAMPKVKITTD
jgi:hypothetical protein